jgi:uncharacterized protein (DUF58 family)
MNPILIISSLLYILVLVAFGSLNGILMALALPLLIYLGAGWFYGRGSVSLRAERQLSRERALPGEPIEVTLTITNTGAHIESLLIEDQLPTGVKIISGETSLLTALPAQASIELRYTLTAPRGYYRFLETLITAADCLGVRQRQILLSTPGRIFVQPRVQRMGRVNIRPRGTRVYAGFIPARKGGSGVEFFGVRQYQQGDPLRWINWRASARHHQALFINQFEQERVADVGIILDTRRRSEVCTRGASLFEFGVNAAAALADSFLNDGNRVGLLLYGTQLDWTLPGYGKIQRERILQSLARAEPGESQVFEKLGNLPKRLLPANSKIVFISPLHADDIPVLIHLRAQGYALLVISPDAVAFERAALDPNDETAQLATRLARIERVLMLHKLTQAGVQVLDWNLNTPLEGALHTTLSRGIPQIHAVEPVR